MRELTLLFGIGCIALSSLSSQVLAEPAYTGPKERLHVYLLIGQSNMAGRAPFSEEESGVIDRSYLFNDKDEWEPARNPLNIYSTIRKKAKMQKMNPGFTFSKAMLDRRRGVSLGLVVNAKGGTRVEQWAKGTEFYAEAVRRARKAAASGVLKGILWHQGESNSSAPGTYLERLSDLVRNLRRDLNEPNLPFVAGQVFYHPEKKPHSKAINDVIAALPGAVPFTACVESKGLTTFDNTHFDGNGMRHLGRRYAEAMLALQSQSRSE